MKCSHIFSCFLLLFSYNLLATEKKNHKLLPPVVTLAVEEGFGIAVEVSGRVVPPHALLLVIQSDEEGSFLDAVQGAFVHATTEVLLPHTSPWNPAQTTEPTFSTLTQQAVKH